MKKYFIILMTAALSLLSCEKALDKKPLSEFGQDAYFRTAEDLQLFSNSFYNNLLDKTPYSAQSDVFITGNLDNRIRGGNNRNGPESGVSWNQSAWNDVRKINTLLEHLDQCEDEAARLQYGAVARFFRALVYYDKVRKFGDIPWVDTELGSADEKLYAPRDSREFVMGKMIEDIDYAIEYLPETKYPYSARVNKYAALALKAKFCLFEGTFRKYHASDVYAESFKDAEHDYAYYLSLAADAAGDLIASNKYRLYSTGKPQEDYVNLFAASDANTDEYILAIHMDASLG
ncbi:MAG: RagB/SusD family nutrient uptake outer membrane protein, partial [Bacteroidales bacterium]|nr:RagB/SusD family nutrient uptake outer membrane protein [Bacteroidales bacterium]